MMRQVDPSFDTFWSLWRKHMRKTDGRGKARPAYQQMLDMGADPQDIIDGAAWYLRNMTERDAPYIPLASSWLRSERWADDCLLEREFNQRMGAAKQASNVTPLHVGPRGQTKFLRQWNEANGAKTGS